MQDIGAYFGGTETPFAFAVTAGSLPAGLSINSSTGVISGTLQAGDVAPPYAVIVTAKDPSNAEVTQQFSLTVTPLPDDVFEDGFETAP